MKLIHGIDQSGTAGKTGSRFDGVVHNYLTMPSTDGVTINTVSFTPGARTHWHTHALGQVLHITDEFIFCGHDFVLGVIYGQHMGG